MPDCMIETKNLHKSFTNGQTETPILKGVNLEIYNKDFTIIMGSSGSGKSTLLYAVSGMDIPTSGEIYFDRTNFSKFNNDELSIFRRENCGFIFQQSYLISHMNILDNVLSTGLLGTKKKKREVVKAAKEYLLQVGLKTEDVNKFPTQLSGGEAQRVGIVRGIINSPRMLFADEPTGALNSASGKAVLDLMTDINRKGQSIVMVTHDIKTAIRGNRLIYLKDGNIVDELRMEPFDEKNMEKRILEVNTFLQKLGW